MQIRNWKRSVKHRGCKGKAVRKTRLTPWRDKYFPKLKSIIKKLRTEYDIPQID